MGATSGAGTAYTSGAPEDSPPPPPPPPRHFLKGFMLLNLSFLCSFCRSLFVLFILANCIVHPSSIYSSWLPLCHSLSRVVVPAMLDSISVNAHFTRFL